MGNNGRGGGDERRGEARGRTPDGEDAGPVQSVDRAVAILEILARDGEAGVTEVARELGVHKSTASRLLAALDRRELVAQDMARGRYRLGVGPGRPAGGSTWCRRAGRCAGRWPRRWARRSTWPFCPGGTRSTWIRWPARPRCRRTTGPGSASRCTPPPTARCCWPTCPRRIWPRA